MVLHGWPITLKSAKKYQNGIALLLHSLHLTVANQRTFEMKRRNHVRRARYATLWSMVGMMNDNEMKL
jgi:hypothetical protein